MPARIHQMKFLNHIPMFYRMSSLEKNESCDLIYLNKAKKTFPGYCISDSVFKSSHGKQKQKKNTPP